MKPSVQRSPALSLSNLAIGESAVVHDISSSNAQLRNKLLSMGIVAGTQLEITRVAPLGDPIKIRFFGGKLSLRLSEAATVKVVRK